MLTDTRLDRIQASPAASKLAASLLCYASEAKNPRALLADALPMIRGELDAAYLAVLRADRGHWGVVGVSGPGREVPGRLASEALDREGPAVDGDWLATPTDPQASEVLIAQLDSGPADLPDRFDAAAAVLAAALEIVRGGQSQRRRVRRLEAILEIAGQWNRTLEMEPLLTKMAETSTRLLGAERASIFLWDRRHKTLDGRPALGVEGGELRIPDDRGIVGQVIRTGQPARADATEGEEVINRQVDRELGFHTRSLLCVPLHGKNGELFGAFELINKKSGTFTTDDEAALTELAAHAAIALENTQEIESLVSTRNQMAEQAAEGVQLIGDSPAIEALRSTIRRIADTELAILVLGENGTGKEVVSQMIHYLSGRKTQPFVAVNCAAMPDTLLESELFGHEKGAFTDAHDSRAGKFELASGGTLFLDEIGDMSPSGPAELLRVLEEKVVVRVGGSQPIHTDARVIAATNQNLVEMVRQGRFREDLYFRLNVVTLELPPLRERGDDVLLLAEHFLRDFAAKARRKMPSLTAAAKKRLRSHSWPGNVRELRNLMERLAYLSTEDRIDADELAFILSPNDEPLGRGSLELSLSDATRKFQTEYIEEQIRRAGGNVTEAAQMMGLHRSNLYRKMRQLGMGEREEGAGVDG